MVLRVKGLQALASWVVTPTWAVGSIASVSSSVWRENRSFPSVVPRRTGASIVRK